MAADADTVGLTQLPAAEPVAPALREELITYLSGFVSERRQRRMHEVLDQRTRWITVVLEDFFQPHNASAVLRSCECFGVQDVHVVEDQNDFDVSRAVALGAAQWLTVERWQAAEGRTIDACCDALQASGYRLVAASPGDEAVSLDQLDVEGARLAILFGTEKEGLTAAAQARVEGTVRVPMHGFTESFNVSVSAALVLRELTGRLRVADVHWHLDEGERRDLLLHWLGISIKRSEDLVARFLAHRDDKEPA